MAGDDPGGVGLDLTQRVLAGGAPAEVDGIDVGQHQQQIGVEAARQALILRLKRPTGIGSSPHRPLRAAASAGKLIA
jgi:hypothetical protein